MDAKEDVVLGDVGGVSRPHRVVALASASVPLAGGPASTAASQGGEGLQFIRVDSGYEAAAEMLSAVAAALVVDMGRLTPPHAPLLDLAAKLAVPVVAFGTISADFSSEQLSRVRMASAEHVCEALREILHLPEPAPEAAPARPAEPAAEPVKPPAATLQPRRPRPPAEEALTQAELDALLREES